jgi:hypothetical protein
MEENAMASMQHCITDCLDCHAVCLGTIQHCLGKGGEHAEPQHVGLLQDCAQICITSADFMLRSSPLHQMTCRICAGICELCAEDCTRLADDETMVLCVETCRRCAASCSEMAAAERMAA